MLVVNHNEGAVKMSLSNSLMPSSILDNVSFNFLFVFLLQSINGTGVRLEHFALSGIDDDMSELESDILTVTSLCGP